MYYESEQDVSLRLKSSVVRHNEHPVYVQDVKSKNEVLVYNLYTKDKYFVQIKDLNLTPVPLGYVTMGKDVLYVSRKPTRKYKQGLTTDNSQGRNVLTGDVGRIPVDNKGLVNTIMGMFPSIEDAFQKVRKDGGIAAFSREWAVAFFKDELCVMYKGDVVGYVGDESVMLSPDKYYLKESLMEVLHGQSN